MPGWNPPADLVFDHAAADAAISEIVAMRHLVEERLEFQVPAFTTAALHWSGQTADLTDRWMTQHHWALGYLIDQLTTLEADIGDAVDDAIIEQARRERLQDAWRVEAAAERALVTQHDGGPE